VVFYIPWLSIAFKIGGYGMCSNVFLIELECKLCKLRFNICRKCYRGHVYCSSRCRSEAQLRSHRKAQSRYRTSDKGREAHCRNERMRRMGRTKKTMADESTNTPPLRVILYPILQNTKSRCCFCGAYGKIVEVFPPR
jgi:nitrate reductase NapE component